jgi:hypothetical protein
LVLKLFFCQRYWQESFLTKFSSIEQSSSKYCESWYIHAFFIMSLQGYGFLF